MPAMAERKPLNRALAEAAQARVDAALPEQAELHELVGFPADLAQAAVQRRGGRPAGARNKRLADVARVVRETLGDTLLQQAAIATMPLADLMALGLKAKEALEEKRLSAATILPYIEQKRPIAVDVTGRQVVHLDIHIGGGEGEQNQGVVEGLVVQLDGAELDAARNPLMQQAVPAAAQLIADQAGEAGREGPDGQARGSAGARATPGGAVFARRRLPHASASVVSPAREVFDPTRNQAGTGPGAGGGA